MFKFSANIREVQRKAKRDISRGLIGKRDACWRLVNAMLTEGVDNRVLVHFFNLFYPTNK